MPTQPLTNPEVALTPTELKAWRESHRYSQTELARVLGITQNAITRWESGNERHGRPIPIWLRAALRGLQPRPEK